MNVPIDGEIERILPIIRVTCATSGGCCVYKNGFGLTVTMGDEELCFFTQEEGRDPNIIRYRLKKLLK